MRTFAIPKLKFHVAIIFCIKEMRMSINSVILNFVGRGIDKIAHIQ